MADTVREVMTAHPMALNSTDTAFDAARTMRDHGIGDVVVMEGEELCGIVTDRDIVVRAVAANSAPDSVQLGEICSRDVATIEPDDPIKDAVQVMRERALRRLLVVDGGNPIGIVTLGDLAVEREPNSVLADISVASPTS